MSELIKFNTADGYTIAASHTKCGAKAVVLWLHGITVDKDEYREFFAQGAAMLAERGIDSVRIDFRGHGESSGSSMEFDVVGQMFDVEAALSYMRTHYDLRATRLGVVGCSFGAPPAIFAGAIYPDIVARLALVCPVLSYQRTFLNAETDWGRSLFNAQSMQRLRETQRLYLDEEFPVSIRLIEEMKILRPDLVLKTLSQPVLAIHGNADSMVPYAVTRSIAQELPQMTFVSMPGMDHGFADEHDEEGLSEKSLANKRRIYTLLKEHFL